MKDLFVRFRKTLLTVVIAAVVLLLAFFLAEAPLQKNEATDKESLAPSVSDTESRASLAYTEQSSYDASQQSKAETTQPSPDASQQSEAVTTQPSHEASQQSKAEITQPSHEASQQSKAEITQPSHEASQQSKAEITQSSHDASQQSKAETTQPSPDASQQSEKDGISCSFGIECSVLVDKRDSLSRNKRGLVPQDGIILRQQEFRAEQGESVFDLTRRVCTEQGIPFEFTLTPLYNSAYIEGIANLYEFDCGSGSGWVYTVNGEMPQVGCSDVKLKDRDIIVWHYTLNYGVVS